MIWRNVVAGDIEDAADFVEYVIKESDSPKKAIAALKSTREAKSPLGPLAKEEYNLFLRTLSPESKKNAIDNQRWFLRAYSEAMRQGVAKWRKNK